MPSFDLQPVNASEPERLPAPILYVTDPSSVGHDAADLFDLAYLLRSPDHLLLGLCLTAADDDIDRLETLFQSSGREIPPLYLGDQGLFEALNTVPDGVNLIVVGGYGMVASLLATHRILFREKNARIFLVGGHANDYVPGQTAIERIPIDPRLRQRNPERFAPGGDPRVPPGERTPFLDVLTSGEGVIWLPRDICLWRYAAAGLLGESGNALAEFLIQALLESRLDDLPTQESGAAEPVLLSTLPALLLATQPDPFAWMRLFRVVAARIEIKAGRISLLSTQTENPNLYMVIAIDGSALGKRLTARLRG